MDFLVKRGAVKDVILIILGTFIMALGINLIYDPMELVTGGVTGLGIVIKYLTKDLFDSGMFADGIPVWLTNIAFNVPLFIISYFVLGPKYIFKTAIATVSLTIFLYVIPVQAVFEVDYTLAALFGGCFAGAGIGLVFLTTATTGGTDMLGMLVHHKWPYYSIPQLLIIIDGAIVIAGAIVFGITKALYAVIAVYVTSKLSDRLLDGLKFAKSAYIVSDKYIEIAEEIMTVLDRGVTSLNGTGMYSKADKNVLYCVVSKKEMIEVLDIVYKNDPHAFVTISDVREVMGEGFIEYNK